MTRLDDAVAELVAAIREEVALERPASPPSGPPRLLSIRDAADALGVGRSTIYTEMDAGRLRSVKVGRRRLIPSDAILTVIGDAGGMARPSPLRKTVPA